MSADFDRDNRKPNKNTQKHKKSYPKDISDEQRFMSKVQKAFKHKKRSLIEEESWEEDWKENYND